MNDKNPIALCKLRRCKGRAFTIIELLVVVVIILVIVALLVPAIGRAREVAKSGACKANLKSLANANAYYATENTDDICPEETYYISSTGVTGTGGAKWYCSFDGTLPGYVVEPNPNRGNPGALLGKYLGTNRSQGSKSEASKLGLLVCPVLDYLGFKPSAGSVVSGTTYYPPLCSYNINSVTPTFYVGSGNAGPGGRKMVDCTSPGTTVLFFEDASVSRDATTGATTFQCRCALGGSERSAQSSTLASTVYNLHGRHYGYANVAWIDGHVDDQLPLIPPDKSSVLYAAVPAKGWPAYTYSQWWSMNSVGFLTPDDHGELYGAIHTPGTFAYNSTNNGTTQFGPAYSYWAHNKDTNDQ